jgi:hypothetical protein
MRLRHTIGAIVISAISSACSFPVPALNGETDRIRETGHLTDARIIDKAQTGWFVNNNPEVEFTLEVRRADGTTYIARARELINLVDLGDIPRGKMLKVYVDRTDPSKVALSGEIAPAQGEDAASAP